MGWVDTKTRYQGVFARHRTSCPIGESGRCRCRPTYYGVAYDRHAKRQVKTKRMATAEAARNARADLMALLERGEARPGGNLRLTEARENFCRAAREGKVLNKRGHRYKPRSIDDIEEVLRVHVEPSLGTKRIIGIRRGDVQAIIDELSPTLSGSRVRLWPTRSGLCIGGPRIATSLSTIPRHCSACRQWTQPRSNALPRQRNLRN